MQSVKSSAIISIVERVGLNPAHKRTFYCGVIAGLIGAGTTLSSFADMRVYTERSIAIAHHEARWEEDLSDFERKERSQAIKRFFEITPPDAWNSPKSLEYEKRLVLQTMQRYKEMQIAYVNFYAHNPYEGRDRASRDTLLKGALSGILLLFGGRSIY